MSENRPRIEIRNFAENMTLDITSTVEPLAQIVVDYIAIHHQKEFNERLNNLEEGYPAAIKERLDELFKPLIDTVKVLEARVQQLEQKLEAQENYEMEMREREI